MNRRWLASCFIALASCTQAPPEPRPAPLEVQVTTAPVNIDDQPAIARGGRLYDDWRAVTAAAPPEAAHPAYPPDKVSAVSPPDTWRCKECHGWDYRGRDGAYGRGSHYTDITGIRARHGAPVDEVIAILKDDNHRYADRLGESDLGDLALFVTRGQVDMTTIIDDHGNVFGNAQRGGVFFATICAGCHGPTGTAEDMPDLGQVARQNPWEFIHKVLNGQPDSEMPALRALDHPIITDIAAYAQSLPVQ